MKSRNHLAKRLTFIVSGLGIVLLISACTMQNDVNDETVHIIPKPLKVIVGEGSFTIQPDTKILVVSDHKDAGNAAEYFAERMNKASGFQLSVDTVKETEGNDRAIVFTTNNADEKLGREGYMLKATDSSVLIKAPEPAGLFYGVQSLMQLLPPEIYSDEKASDDIQWSIPAATITDKPRFGWRGMHLDVSRHFFSKESVKRYIDMLAMHKMNVFHWHLVDDQGWRIEIKKYPKLTEIGAKRVDLPWNNWQSQDTVGKPIYQGYYTREDIKEIVAFAQKRSVTIVPEIEMPGHTLASLAAYPELSCTGGPFRVPSGGVDIWTNHTYCPGNEKTFEFLEEVLGEIMELFPSTYIHIGGDETTRIRWRECPKCQKRMKQENLRDEEELYGYFIQRIEKFLESRGRKLIGWDEILEGGDSLNGTVMSWRGVDRCLKAVDRGRDVVLTPSSHLYFDDNQVNGESRVPLEMVYSYEPVPADVSVDDEKHILGAQACVWTEHVTSMQQVERITLPRMAALAEITWTDKKLRNFEHFLTRLAFQYDRYNAMKLHYRQPDLEGGFSGKHVFTDSILVRIIKPRLNSTVRYTLDGSEPTLQSPSYDEPFYIATSTVLKAREFLPDGAKGRVRVGIYEKQQLRTPVRASNLEPGLFYKYIQGEYTSTAEIPSDKFTQEGVIDNFVFPPNHSKLFFAVLYSGFIRVPKDGVYTFYCETNDGSQLYIGDQLVVDHGGLHPAEEKSGDIALRAGYHPIRVLYFQNAGSSFIKISYKGPDIEKEEIPASVLFH